MGVGGEVSKPFRSSSFMESSVLTSQQNKGHGLFYFTLAKVCYMYAQWVLSDYGVLFLFLDSVKLQHHDDSDTFRECWVILPFP